MKIASCHVHVLLSCPVTADTSTVFVYIWRRRARESKCLQQCCSAR